MIQFEWPSLRLLTMHIPTIQSILQVSYHIKVIYKRIKTIHFISVTSTKNTQPLLYIHQSVRSSQSLNKIITTIDTRILLILLRLKSPRNSLDKALEVGIAKVSAPQISPDSKVIYRYKYLRNTVARWIRLCLFLRWLDNSVDSTLDHIIAPSSK
jgi:hypothetical protein